MLIRGGGGYIYVCTYRPPYQPRLALPSNNSDLNSSQSRLREYLVYRLVAVVSDIEPNGSTGSVLFSLIFNCSFITEEIEQKHCKTSSTGWEYVGKVRRQCFAYYCISMILNGRELDLAMNSFI